MDITRNWRLKNTRSQLLATRRPDGTVILPQHTGARQQNQVYVFDTAPKSESEAEFSQAAR